MSGRYRFASVISATILPFAPAVVLSKSDCKDDSNLSSTDKKNSIHDVAVYLAPASRTELNAYLRKMGIEGNVDTSRVVVRRSCNSSDSYLYEPLFGERAAFRIKGLIRSESGATVAMGRVSTLTGELTDDDCDASMVLKSADSSSHGNAENLAIDIPTRITEMKLQIDKEWKGEIPPGRVLRSDYPAHKVEFEAIPSEKQLVVAGIICSSLYVDKDGNCTFDRATDMQQSGAPVPSEEEIQNPRKNARRNNDDAKTDPVNTEPVNENECPVCRYMKGGACKKDFESWEECVESLGDSEDLTKCFDITMEMMKCMRANEYYDIMTAGTEEKYAAAESAASATDNATAAAP